MTVQSERDLRLSLPTVFNAGLRRNTSQATYREEPQSGKYVHLPQDELSRAAPLDSPAFQTRDVHASRVWLKVNPASSRSASLNTPRDSQLSTLACYSQLKQRGLLPRKAPEANRLQHMPMMLRLQSSQEIRRGLPIVAA